MAVKSDASAIGVVFALLNDVVTAAVEAASQSRNLGER